MSEKYSFFDSVDKDRAYYAADWALHLSKYFTNGIFDNGLQVVISDGMNVSVSSGDANINGYRYTNDSEKVIAVSNADGILNRIDNIVVRLDIPNRQITTEIVTGDFAETAVAPSLTRGTSIYDLRIAKISIPAGTTEITEDLITDTRFDDDDCGNVICAVQNPDFSNVLTQYKALWNALIEKESESFESWFEEIKDQLSEDAAGNLQLEIDNILDYINDICKYNVIIPAGTIISNGYTITLNYYYCYLMNNLEVYWNGIKLIQKTVDNDDGQYLEVSSGTYKGNFLLGNTIQFYRTDEDGDYELTEDVNLEIIIKPLIISL